MEVEKDTSITLEEVYKKHTLYNRIFNRKYPRLAGFAATLEDPSLNVLMKHFLEEEVRGYEFKGIKLG